MKIDTPGIDPLVATTTSNNMQGVTNGPALGFGLAKQVTITNTSGPANFSALNVPMGQPTLTSNAVTMGRTLYNETGIKTNKHTIDLNELGDMMETVKKRLLILTPNFEQLEQYPMLKAAYDEFKMLEKLLCATSNDK